LGNYTDFDGETEDSAASAAIPEGDAGASDNDSLVWNIINAFGGQENISEVDACMTRLRVTVKDETKVAEDKKWSTLGARGVIRKGKGIQVVYGPQADVLKSDIIDLLGR
jgi:PTS system glucose-specific IIC component